MRSKGEIQKDGTRVDILSLEVLLDIRELLKKSTKRKKIKKEEKNNEKKL